MITELVFLYVEGCYSGLPNISANYMIDENLLRAFTALKLGLEVDRFNQNLAVFVDSQS